MYKYLKQIIGKYPSLKRILILIRDTIIYNSKKMFIYTGIRKKQTSFRRFIIIGLARTGSNFLKGLLNSHPEIITFGELFRFQETIGWDLRHHPQSKQLNELKNRYPLKFLEQEIYNWHPSRIKLVGFKLLYHQARSDNHRIIWDFVKNSEDIKIIHLKRKNYLRRYLSWRRAWDTGEWVKYSDEENDNYSIELSYEECKKEFEELEKEEKEMDTFLKDKEVLTIYYEDLAENTSDNMEKVFRFIGVGSEEIKSRTLKQIELPLSESITNYNSLKKQFANGRWSSFFED